MNYYPFHIGDYKAHSAHLTIIEDIAHRRMLDNYYLSEKPLPSNVDQISREIGMHDHKKEIEYVLSKFFKLTLDGFISKRANEEIQKYRSKIESAKRNGSAGGRPKRNAETKTKPPALENKAPGSKMEADASKNEADAQLTITRTRTNNVERDKSLSSAGIRQTRDQAISKPSMETPTEPDKPTPPSGINPDDQGDGFDFPEDVDAPIYDDITIDPEKAKNDSALSALARHAERINPKDATPKDWKRVAIACAMIRQTTQRVTGIEIARRCAHYALHFKSADITAMAIARHWGRLDNPPPERKPSNIVDINDIQRQRAAI